MNCFFLNSLCIPDFSDQVSKDLHNATLSGGFLTVITIWPCSSTRKHYHPPSWNRFFFFFGSMTPYFLGFILSLWPPLSVTLPVSPCPVYSLGLSILSASHFIFSPLTVSSISMAWNTLRMYICYTLSIKYVQYSNGSPKWTSHLYTLGNLLLFQ